MPEKSTDFAGDACFAMKFAVRESSPFLVGLLAQRLLRRGVLNQLQAGVAIALLLSGAGAATSRAQTGVTAKTAPPDVLIFTNGDQLTGKFLRSSGGNAVFHSDMAGDVTVSWDKVKEIHSASKFVVLQKGFQPGRKALPAHVPEGTSAVANKQIELTPSEGGADRADPADECGRL